MSTITHPIEAAEIPASRRFRLDADRLRRAIGSGLLAPGHAPGDRLTLTQYHQLGEAGLLTKSDRVELLGGWLVARMPINPPHRISTRKVRIALDRVLPPGWYTDEQKPVTLPVSGSEPEPDVQVTRGDTADYLDRHPGPRDIGLIVEVSDSTLSDDRNFQKRLYATDGIPVYWIINLRIRKVEVYSEPSGPAEEPDYARRRDYTADEEIPLELDGREIARVAGRDLLP